MGIMVLTQISRSRLKQSKLSAHPTSTFRAFCKRFGDFWVCLKLLVAMATLKTTDIEMTYKDFRDGC